jgi:hypothetical protein
MANIELHRAQHDTTAAILLQMIIDQQKSSLGRTCLKSEG